MNAFSNHPAQALLPVDQLALPPADRNDADLLDLAYQAGLLPECRRSPRRNIRVEIKATPIDHHGTPQGAPFVAESLNISATGICLMTTEPVMTKHLLVEMPGIRSDSKPVPVEIIRCTPKDNRYEVAGPFVTLPSENPSDGVMSCPDP